MVKIKTSGLHFTITPALEEHAQEQFSKVAENFEALIVEDITVTMAVDTHHKHINKVTVKVPLKGNDVVVNDEGTDMYKVITAAARKVARSVRKNKERVTAHTGKDKRAITDDVDEE